jgi:hypothetical protein
MEGKEKAKNFFCRFPKMDGRVPYKKWWREARRGEGGASSSNLTRTHCNFGRKPTPSCSSFIPNPRSALVLLNIGKTGKASQKPTKIQLLKTFVKFCLLYQEKCGLETHVCAKHHAHPTRMWFTHIHMCKTLMPFLPI